MPTPIPILSEAWLTANGLGLLTLTVVMLIGWRLEPEARGRLAVGIGVFMGLRFLALHGRLLQLDIWSIDKHLPLHMSSLASILACVAPLTRRALPYEMLLLWGVVAGFHANMTPLLPYGDDPWLHVDFFVGHWGMMILPLYMTFILGRRPRPWTWLRVFGVTNLLLVFIGAVNVLVGGNYMYMMSPPPVQNPLIQGEWPWYYLGFEFAGFAQWTIVYLLIRAATRRRAGPEAVPA